MAPKANGAAHGSRIRKRITARPTNFCWSVRARMFPSTITRISDTKVKMNVFVRADRKMVLSIALKKFVSPTYPRVCEPVVALLRLR